MPDRITDASAPAVAPHLAAGERVAVIAIVMADPGVVEPVSLRDEAKNLLDPTLWIGLGAHPGEALRRLTFGRAVTGDKDSTAARLHSAVSAARAPRLVVTDRRLVVGSLDMPGADPATWRFTPQLSDPRAVVVSARRAPKGALRRGRILLDCADGSSVAVVATRQQVQALVDAVNGG